MVFITESGKEIQVPSDYTYMSLEKFAKEIYQQGRADQRKEDEELNYHYATSHECYMKGRADAIDECIDLIKKCCPCEEVGAFNLLVCGLEQLKEQKNE